MWSIYAPAIKRMRQPVSCIVRERIWSGAGSKHLLAPQNVFSKQSALVSSIRRGFSAFQLKLFDIVNPVAYNVHRTYVRLGLRECKGVYQAAIIVRGVEMQWK